MDCLYLGEKVGATEDGRDSHACRIHEICTKVGHTTPYASCASCKEKLTLESTNLGKAYRDPLEMLDRNRERTHSLRGMLAGGQAFLICGGPSAKNYPVELLNKRGIF